MSVSGEVDVRVVGEDIEGCLSDFLHGGAEAGCGFVVYFSAFKGAAYDTHLFFWKFTPVLSIFKTSGSYIIVQLNWGVAKG